MAIPGNFAKSFHHKIEEPDRMKLETIAVHGGYTPDPTTKAVAVPVYQTASYAFDSAQHGADPGQRAR